MKEECNDSQINFDKWSKMSYTPTVIDEEMHTQKKRAFTTKQIAATSNPCPSNSNTQSAKAPRSKVSVAVQVES